MDEEPLVKVVRGEPTAEELAALVGALITTSTRTDGATPDASASPWTRSARPRTAPGSWRDSGLPH